MASPRWTKTWREMWLARGRVAMMVLAIAVGVVGVGTILDAYTILTREISRNYLDTRPASASLELDRVDDALLDQVRHQAGIAVAQARGSALARVQAADGQWLALKAFIVPDFRDMQLSTFFPNSGAWPPPPGTLLLERQALELIGMKERATLTVRDGDGKEHHLAISGTVHDPSLAPAGQEQSVYAYMTPATAQTLGDIHLESILKVTVSGNAMDEQHIATTVGALAAWLRAHGHEVRSIAVPPPGQHPHQGQMSGMLLMLMTFGGLALLVSAVLSATMVNAMLAQQVRQIGVMKTIGARSGQIARLYLGAMLVMGLAACAVGVPVASMAGRALSRAVAQLLNFSLSSQAVPHWATLAQIAAGTLLPLLLTAIPVRRASRITVRDAIDDVGVARKGFGRSRMDALLARVRGVDRTLLLALRNSFRRRGRLVLTLALLATAGALFISSLNVTSAWKHNLALSAGDRHYDMELSLNHPEDEQRVLSLLRTLPGVQAAEGWSREPATRPRDDGQAIERTYPDGGHGSLSLRAVPPATRLISLTMLEGRWLQPGDDGTIVLNPGARARFREARVGDTITLAIRDRKVQLRVIGFAREILSPAQGYVTPATFARVVDGAAGKTDVVRVALDQHDDATRAAMAARAERALEQAGIGVRLTITESTLGDALGGHVAILIFNLVAISVLMGIVGVLGLASSMSTAVVERTREIGVMRAIGASGATLMRNLVGEALVIGAMSWIVALVLSLPLSAWLDGFLGRASFGMALPFVVSPFACALWLFLVLAGATLASLLPARRAAALPVRDALAYV